MITEEQKQEADRILEIYRLTTYGSIDTIRNAIQDRQSVLEDNKSVFEMLKLHGDIRICWPIHERIQSLTNQIIYLKSKL